MRHTIIIDAYNEHGVLYRIVDLLLRRKIHIVQLSMKTAGRPERARFTIVVKNTDVPTVEKVVQQMQRIIEVIHAAIK